MKTNKLIYAMFCICMFFCGCMTTTQSTVQSLINVQRTDNSEPLKIGTIVYYSDAQTIFSAQTIFRIGQVLNNRSFEFDNYNTNTYYVSQMVLVNAYAYNKTLDGFYLDTKKYMSAYIIPSKGHFYSSEQSIVKGYYKYLGNYTYETVSKNPNGSPKYNTLRVFCEVDEPIDDTK